MTNTEPLDLDAAEARAVRASAEVARLKAAPLHWYWSIPADPERDSDLILGASVGDVPALIAEVRRLRPRVLITKDEVAQLPVGSVIRDQVRTLILDRLSTRVVGWMDSWGDDRLPVLPATVLYTPEESR